MSYFFILQTAVVSGLTLYLYVCGINRSASFLSLFLMVVFLWVLPTASLTGRGG